MLPPTRSSLPITSAPPVPPKRTRRTRSPTPPAETGRPETSAEFARRVKHRFVLLGPGKRKKGGKSGADAPQHTSTALDAPQNTSTTRVEHVTSTEDPSNTNNPPVTRIPLVVYPNNEGLLKAAKNKYHEDPFFKQIVDDPSAFKNFEITPDIEVNGRRLREMIIDQAHSILAHLGARKTTSYIREFLWWDSMVKDITQFLWTAESATRTFPAMGSDRCRLCWATTRVEGSGWRIRLHYCHHRHCTRNCGVNVLRSIQTSWTAPGNNQRQRCVVYESLHPETDGATERANRTIAQMLRSCIGPNQRDWVARIPFFLNTGRMPRQLIWDAPAKDEYPSVRAFANRMKLTIMDAHDAILKARVKQTVGANRKRRTCPFVKGDLVYISHNR